jgi:dTDP-4-amino-4,6-dideoxygalactose transaminase
LLKYYRPVGNKILLKRSPFDANRLSPLNASFFQSGTASLAIAVIACCNLKSVDVKKAEILLPAYACPDLISAIIFAGARPVLIDLQERSTFLSLAEVEKHINQNTVAIIAVNFLGIKERVFELKTICESHHLFLINDSAQWFPKRTTNSDWPGDFNIISFGRGKPVSLLHGGAVITKELEKKQAIDKISVSSLDEKSNLSIYIKIFVYNLVIQPYLYGLISKIPGLNIGETKFTPLTIISKMDSGYLSVLEKNLEAYSSRKSVQHTIKTCLNRFEDSKIIDLCPDDLSFHEINLLRYPILITDHAIRDLFYEKAAYLGVSTMYRKPLNKISGLNDLLDSQKTYANATNFANHLITLPTHEGIEPWIIYKIFDLLEISLNQPYK